MRKLSQKIIALILALVMCASMLSVAGAADLQEDSQSLETTAEESSQEGAVSDEDVDFISEEEKFLELGKSTTLNLTQTPQAETYFASKNTKVVSVNAESGEVKAQGIGSAAIELRRSEDGKVLDSITFYSFRPTTTKRASGTNKREKPANLTTSNAVAPTRTYKLVCQQKYKPSEQPFDKYLSHHGCTSCASLALCQAYGATDMTVDWMMSGGLEEIALRNGFSLQDKTMGFYGMQKVLEYAGISSKIYNWKDDSPANMTAAKTEMVKALSAGRPVLMFLDQNSKWNGIGPLCVELHCVLFVGIDKDGYVQYINSSYPHLVSGYNKSGTATSAKITVSQLIDHFVRHSKMKRTKTDDFWFSKSGGLHTFLEVTCDKATVPSRTSIANMSASLAQSEYTYTGEAFTPKVSVAGLTEEEQFRVRYSDNVSAGTAKAAVVGLGDYCGIQHFKFTINRAAGKVTAKDKTVLSKSVEQTVKLGATALGNAKITYTSSDEKVTVDSAGKVTVPADYVGEVTFTLKSAKTNNYKAASKKIKLTVKADPTAVNLADGKISASNKSLVSKSKKQKVKLGAKARGDAKITYTASDKKVKVSSDGVVTIPKDYAGIVSIQMVSERTDKLKAASKTVKVTVSPAKPALSQVKAQGSAAAQVKWKKVKNASGYLVQYWRTDKKNKIRQKGVGKQKTTSLKLKKLTKGKVYRVRIRSYKTVSGKKIYSPWSAEKSVRIK